VGFIEFDPAGFLLCPIGHDIPIYFSNEIPFARPTFCQQQQKVSKKCRPPNNALLPLSRG